LRVSHREVDPVRSTEQLVLCHERECKVRPGDPVAVDIEIWLSGTHFPAGETLRLIMQGRDIQEYPPSRVYARHQSIVNRGRHLILSGGMYDSSLTIPAISSP
jgi:predicted acyl esterase